LKPISSSLFIRPGLPRSSSITQFNNSAKLTSVCAELSGDYKMAENSLIKLAQAEVSMIQYNYDAAFQTLSKYFDVTQTIRARPAQYGSDCVIRSVPDTAKEIG
jgi:hypothetical protein